MSLKSRNTANTVNHLIAALFTRLQRLVGSGDPSEVLDTAALDEASRLWEAVLPADGNLQAVPVDVLTALAYLHWSRYQVLPEGQDQHDLRKALAFCGSTTEDRTTVRWLVPPGRRSSHRSVTARYDCSLGAAVARPLGALAAPG